MTAREMWAGVRMVLIAYGAIGLLLGLTFVWALMLCVMWDTMVATGIAFGTGLLLVLTFWLVLMFYGVWNR
jgi:hypothetical protein